MQGDARRARARAGTAVGRGRRLVESDGLSPVAVTVPPTLPPPHPRPPIAAAGGHGDRELAAAALAAPGAPRATSRAGCAEAEFEATADDAVRLAVEAQLRAGVDVVTDGEQRRDNYASFVGRPARQLPADPAHRPAARSSTTPRTSKREMRSLDVPASEVRHPAVFGPPRAEPAARRCTSSRSSAALTDRPVKVALPGPVSPHADDVARVHLRPRRTRPRAARRGHRARSCARSSTSCSPPVSALVQFDEPVLTEVVFTGAKNDAELHVRGAQREGRRGPRARLRRGLVNRVAAGLPRERLGLHVCRGNWTPRRGGGARRRLSPAPPAPASLDVGTLFLELATPRAGELDVLADLPPELRLGVGVVNQKHDGSSRSRRSRPGAAGREALRRRPRAADAGLRLRHLRRQSRDRGERRRSQAEGDRGSRRALRRG